MSEPLTLKPMERRLLGVLIEKALTTPNQYPLSLNGLVVGANQKSNRDPVVHYDEDQVYDCLERLKARGLVSLIYPGGSRVEKFKQELTSELDLNGAQKAVIGELLLRGAQTTGELRTRASRMCRLDDMEALQQTLDQLTSRQPPLVIRLSPPEVRRGVRVTHGFYPADELATVRRAEADVPVEPDSEGELSGHERSTSSGAGARREPTGLSLAALAEQVAELRSRVERLEADRGGL
ncbi:MAG: YceH family protein [Planctomycetota bacterium]